MIEHRKLSNGIRLAMEKLPHVESTSIGVWIKAGAVDEKDTDAGISHFIEHMMFKGTEKRDAKQIAEDVDMIGGHVNAFTGKEATCYYIKTLSSNMDKAMEILSDMISNSVFDETEMGKEKNVIFEEMKMVEDSPEDFTYDLISEAIFKDSKLGNRIIGTQDTVGNTIRADILKYKSEKYSAENIVISIAGNIDIEKTVEYAERGFAGIPSKQVSRIITPKEYNPVYTVKEKDIEQTHIAIGKRGVAYEADDYYSFNLFNSILGGGMSSRLFQNVREERGLAYSVYSISSSFVDDGYFIIYAAVGEDKAEETIEAIREEVLDLKNKGINNKELRIAKEQMKGNYIFGLENINGRMFSTGKNTLLLNKTFTQEEVIRDIEAVTESDIMNVADKVSDLNDFSAVILSRKDYDAERLLKK